MSHAAGVCDCGRTIRFPAKSKSGDQWKCRKCGKVCYITSNPILSLFAQKLNTQRSTKKGTGKSTTSGGLFGSIIRFLG